MSIHNALALLNWYRLKNVAAVKTPSGIVFMGMRNVTADQRRTLLAIPQADLEAALRIQQ